MQSLNGSVYFKTRIYLFIYIYQYKKCIKFFLKKTFIIFPALIILGERVLKQNIGATGQGIWRVVVPKSSKVPKGKPITLDTRVKCTHAEDNGVHYYKLGEFLDFCNQYIDKPNGGWVFFKNCFLFNFLVISVFSLLTPPPWRVINSECLKHGDWGVICGEVTIF